MAGRSKSSTGLKYEMPPAEVTGLREEREREGKGWERKTGNFAWALRPVTLEGWQGLQIADWIERLEFPGEGSIQFN